MAGTAGKGPTPGKVAQPRKGTAASASLPGIIGLAAILAGITVGIKHLGSKSEVSRFNMTMNLEHIVEGNKNSAITDLALRNLESMKKVGGDELILLKEAIRKVERKCKGDCGMLIKRMEALQKKWEARIDSGRPVSDLRWTRPGLGNARVLRRIPQKVARSRC